MKFIFVFSNEDRDKMISLGFNMLHAKKCNINGARDSDMFIFENKRVHDDESYLVCDTFSMKSFCDIDDFVMSDVMCF